MAARDPDSAAWLASITTAPPLPGSPAFMRAFAMAGRRLRGATALSDGEQAVLRFLGIARPDCWPLQRLLRAGMLAAAVDASGDEAAARLTSAFRTSDNEERATILQSLVLLPSPDRFAPLAADACRSSVQPVFEAIAADNGFPASHFTDLAFNQMVLKAVFTGLALARVVGLELRTTAVLRRMAADFRSERRAAGRPVPADLDALLADPPDAPPCAPPDSSHR
ncbi:EboA domain-containing protein [Azospirillum picis]|uniref:EboA domain-containing protein n=1 Tax=Azospirillum picis TaxID=488438 RepID=UPI0027D7AC51|nr:EboA domain-containing protein [Azospirillum picis]MBP2300803.1 hypothetical protein [Azospirillum picis]